MKILIDNGHGVDTAGKRSPDGSLREYSYTREIARRIVQALTAEGFDAERIVTEEEDISLKERCRRVNAVCRSLFQFHKGTIRTFNRRLLTALTQISIP